MTRIHSTAIIDPAAKIDPTVQIGPGCIIQGPVQIGAGTRLICRVTLDGAVHIGQRNVLYPQVCIGFAPQHREFDPKTEGSGVTLGNENILREGVTIHRASGPTPTTIGDRNYLMVNSHLGHDVQMGNEGTLANGALVGGHCTLGDRVLIGGNAGVHQFCRMGRLSIISGAAGIVKDLPPFCCVYALRCLGSLNLVGLRRARLHPHIDALNHAFDLLYRNQHSNAIAIKLIEQQLGHDPLCMELAEFVRTTKRGITSHVASNGTEEPQIHSESKITNELSKAISHP